MSEQRVRARPEPFRASFATIDRARGMTELQCPMCAAVIGKMLPVGHQQVRRVRGQTFVETQLQFCYLANYREVEFDMLDADKVERAGKHVGAACVECAPKLQADPALQERYAETQLKQWRAEGTTITERMDRRPDRVLRVADFIRD